MLVKIEMVNKIEKPVNVPINAKLSISNATTKLIFPQQISLRITNMDLSVCFVAS